MERSKLINYLDEYLLVKDFAYDPSVNGLQIEGFDEVEVIATSADASLDSIDAARELGADTLIVHHGLLWQGDDRSITGTFKDRVNAALEANLNLIAYHLPLDAHLHVGNNAFLCSLLGDGDSDYIVPGDKSSIAMRKVLNKPKSVREICALLCKKLDCRVGIVGNVSEDFLLNDFAVCSGSGGSVIDKCRSPSFDALITGEINEQTYNAAIESGTVVFIVGHHASEQDGVRLLGEDLAKKFNLTHHHLHFAYEKNIAWFE